MRQFYEKQIINGAGEPMRVIWDYDPISERYWQENPEAFFNEIIVPKFEEAKYPYWRDYIAGRYGYEWLTYNYELICFVTNGNPLDAGNAWGGNSFPSFLSYHLEVWAGKQILAWRRPPKDPFYFNCYSFTSGNNDYYLQSDTEKALTRDFKKYPATEDEKRIWRAIMHNTRIAKATDAERAQFLAGYLLRKGRTLYDLEENKHFYKTITL